MCNFSQRYSLELKNVVSFRGFVTQQEAMKKLQEIIESVNESGAVSIGPVITCTHEAMDSGLSDFEVLIPTDKPICVEAPFVFQESFQLNNCLKVAQMGDPQMIQPKISLLYDYVEKNGLIPVSSGYTVVTHKGSRGLEIDGMISEFYVPIAL